MILEIWVLNNVTSSFRESDFVKSNFETSKILTEGEKVKSVDFGSIWRKTRNCLKVAFFVLAMNKFRISFAPTHFKKIYHSFENS